jgi:hypothetical protein
MANRVTLEGIGSYVTVLEPKPDLKGQMKYSISVLIPKKFPGRIDPLKAAILQAAKEKWGDKALAVISKARYPTIRDGDTEVTKDGDPVKETKGMWVVRTRSDRKPGIVGPNPKEPMHFDDDNCYSGCTFRVSVSVYAYEAEGNRGVTCGLEAVQVCAQGPRIDGRLAAEDAFAEYKPEDVDPLE